MNGKNQWILFFFLEWTNISITTDRIEEMRLLSSGKEKSLLDFCSTLKAKEVCMKWRGVARPCARQSISITLSVLFIRRLFKENLIYFTSTGFKMYPLSNELFVVILVFSSHQITWAPPPSSTRTMLLRLSFPLLMSTNSVCRRWLAATLKLELTKELISSD